MLTARQTQILEFLKAHIKEKGFPPTRAEIQLHFGYHSVNAAEEHLRAIQRRGYIQLIRGASRGIRMLEQSQKPSLPPDSQWEEVCRDAERYRWLREQHWTKDTLSVVRTECLGIGDDTFTLDLLDRAIDDLRGIAHDIKAPSDTESPLPG